MIVLNFKNLSLNRGPRVLFEDANFSIFAKQKVALVGANGCGKSSLFAMLLGTLACDHGELSIPSQVRIAHLAQHTPDVETPALEYVKQGDKALYQVEQALAKAQAAGDGNAITKLYQQLEDLDGYRATSKAAELLKGLGFQDQEFQKPVRDFSGGWRVRLNLAQTLMQPSDLLLLDEPTNHLDLDAIIWLERFLQLYQGTLVLISHDRDFLDTICSHTIHIEHGKIELYTGNYSDFERLRAEKLALQQATYEKQQKAVAHMQSFVDRFRAKATKAKQAQSRLKAIEKMELVSAVQVDSAFDFSFKAGIKCPNPMLTLNDVKLGYGEHIVLPKVRFSLQAGSRIGLLGPNGAGKSTLVKHLAGELAELGGERLANQPLKIGYFAQHQLEQLEPSQSPLTHLRLLAPEAKESQLRSFLGQFNFIGDMATSPVAPFSGGEKARLVLALLVWQAPNLLLLDEPTNHLDMEMRNALALALQSFEGSIILVSHDRYLLRSTCDEYYLVANGEVNNFQDDLQGYQQWLNEYRREQQPKREKKTNKTAPVDNSKKIQALERDMQKLSTKLTEVEAKLANEDLYNGERGDELKQLLTKQESLKEKLAELEEKWLGLA